MSGPKQHSWWSIGRLRASPDTDRRSGRQDERVSTRLPPLLDPPVAFGRSSFGPDGLESSDGQIQPAVDAGVAGVAADVWITADGVPVVAPGPKVGPRLRRQTIATTDLADLSTAVVPLRELYRVVGPECHLSLDLRDPNGLLPVLEVARQAGEAAEDRLWLCQPELSVLTDWRPRTTACLINVASLRSLGGGLEPRAAELEQLGIDGLRLDHGSWSGGRIALLHRFGRLALADGIVHEREAAAALDAGIDAAYSERIGPLVAVLGQFYDLA